MGYVRELPRLLMNGYLIQRLEKTTKGMGTNFASLSLARHGYNKISCSARDSRKSTSSLLAPKKLPLSRRLRNSNTSLSENVSPICSPFECRSGSQTFADQSQGVEKRILSLFEDLQKHYMKETRVAFIRVTTTARDLLGSKFAPSLIFVKE